MFPFDLDEEDLNIKVESETPKSDYEIDFETGKLTGRIITGLEAIIQWIKIALVTNRYYFPQYSWTHGSDLVSLIGQNFDEDYIDTEVKRMIREILSSDDAITGFENLDIKMESDRLLIAFTVNTIYGGGEVNVR